MKKTISVFLALIMVFSVFGSFSAYAETGTEDYYSTDLDDGTVEIMYYAGSDYTILIPASINGKPVSSIGMGAFQFSKPINVTMPVSLKKICASAFEAADIKFLTLNEGLERIEDGAFNNCEQLQGARIPSTVSFIAEDAFASDLNMKEFTVADGNEYYSADGVALFNKDKTALIRYAAANAKETYTLPLTVQRLAPYSMSRLTKLKVLGIPKSVTAIELGAFNESASLTDVYYAGTAEEWAAVSKADKNTVLNTVTMHFEELPKCETHTWNEGEITTQPTCTEKGVKTFTCTVCGETRTEDVDPTGIHTWNDGEITTPPTCTEKGVKTYTCTVCGGTRTEDVDPTGIHTWNDGEITTQPTCTEKGVKTFTCTVCGGTRTEDVDPTGIHSWNDGEITTQPTCTKNGIKTFTCITCGEIRTEEIASSGAHTAVTDKAVPATFTSEGKTKGTHCSVCGMVLTPQKTVAKLGAPHIVKLKMNSKGLTIKWSRVYKVHGYKIQISKSKKFKNAKTFTVRNQKQVKRLIKRYKKGRYYVRIRAYKVINNKTEYSKWSKKKSVKK